MSKKKIVGTNALTYPELRNFAGLNLPNYEFKKVLDGYKIPSYLQFKLFKKLNRKWQNSFYDFGLNNIDFFHFFNVLNCGKKPYFTTYETALPRWRDNDGDFKKGLALIAKNNCKKIIAISKCAYHLQQNIIEKYAPELLPIITTKNCVMLPPQKILIQNYSEKKLNTHFIVFTLVGADFFRKGGAAILNVFDKLLEQKLPLKLNIVSSLNFGDYASKTTLKDKEIAIQIIEKYPENIIYYPSLSNLKVEELLINTHVALLPSLAETFGYFILEAQAAACPVITTDIRAMPEINNNETGWIMPIKAANSYDADITLPNKLIEQISLQLEKIIIEIVGNKTLIETKGNKALQNIISNHSVEKHKAKLSSLYNFN